MEFTKPKIESKVDASGMVGTIEVAPLQCGYGLTIGNALRRVLLTTVPGTAVTKIAISGDNGQILHEFTSVKGVKEDVCELVLNVKEIVAQMNQTEPYKAVIDVVGPCVVTDSMISGSGVLQFLNPGHQIATVEKGSRLYMELTFEHGYGFVSQSQNKQNAEESVIGEIFVDSIFTPVKKVGYRVENMRINGENFDKLVIDVETNGVKTVNQAIGYAAGILNLHFGVFSQLAGDCFGEPTMKGEDVDPSAGILTKPIEELELTVRSYNCLKRAGVQTIGELIKKSVSEMMKMRNLGAKSFEEIKLKLASLGFEFRPDED